MGRRNCLVLEHSLYDDCFCANVVGDSCAGTDTIVTDTVSETTLGAGAGWSATNVDGVFNYDGNLG